MYPPVQYSKKISIRLLEDWVHSPKTYNPCWSSWQRARGDNIDVQMLTPGRKVDDLDLLISQQRAELKDLKTRNEQLYSTISAGRAHRVLRSSASSAGSTSVGSPPSDKGKMVRVLRLWGNEKSDGQSRSMEDELEDEDSPEVRKAPCMLLMFYLSSLKECIAVQLSKRSTTEPLLSSKAVMSPWKVHIESFKNVKEEAAAAKRVVHDLQAELQIMKEQLSQTNSILKHEQASRKSMESKYTDLRGELNGKCAATMDLMVSDRLSAICRHVAN